MKIFFVLTALKVDCDQFIIEFYNCDQTIEKKANGLVEIQFDTMIKKEAKQKKTK